MMDNDPGTVFSRAKRAKILELENEQLRAEIEKLQAECRAYRQLVAQCQEDETNRRALEQAQRRAAVDGMMGPLPEKEKSR